ncbi:MAG: phospho-N-acetylmuramoyl-pentapeptide-transferase [Parcubacteria group bacterium]|nr:phospho-N-acetylmuramoyl-pentapeptide-transferase [Parcubacteria group bacterium]
MVSFYIVKILFLMTLSFVIAILWTPVLTHFLYKYKLGKHIRDDGTTPVMTGLHKKKEGTPTMGGVLIWVTALVVALVFFYLSKWFPDTIFSQLNFLTRSQTLLPLGALVVSGLAGLADDWLNVRNKIAKSGGFTIRHRLLLYTIIALAGAWWFYFKLGWDELHLPFLGNLSIGYWYLPFFVVVIVATSFSVNLIDGLDGLAGGTLLSALAAFSAIAFIQGKYDLAAFCAVLIGGLLAFLWFNITPARFFMGDTGAMSLGVVLGIVAMLTNTALYLPVIGFLFVVEALSVLIQVASKKLWGKKVFISAPIHHHFEAIGWSEPKIVMRFWVISWVTAGIGLMFFLLERSL